jgi:cyclin-dependent kinase 8/11
MAVNFLSKLFIYDPDKRMTAREALSHSWFQEDPQPTYKSVWFSFCSPMEIEKRPTSVFEQQLSNPSQLPPQRRITLDEAPSMMPAQATHAQQLPAQFTQQQHLQGQTQGSAASLSGGHAGHTKKRRIG